MSSSIPPTEHSPTTSKVLWARGTGEFTVFVYLKSFHNLNGKMGPIGVSAMVDLYVQKVCLEATQLIASLKMEVMVMHTVNGYPDEGWDNAVTSAQKIVEFIDLFCKKSQQKISMLALVIIDKLQGAHNKFLEAARTKHSEIAKTIALTSAKLLQKAAKFYTYALIAERSGQTVFRALHIQAGR